MDFRVSDIKLLTIMLIAVIIMSFTMTSFGLADSDDEITASDVPQYEPSFSEFDMAGEMPRSPGTPSSGELVWEQQLKGDSENQIWLTGGPRASSNDKNDGYEVTWINFGNKSDPQMNVTLNNWNDGNLSKSDSITLDRGDLHIDSLIEDDSSAIFDDMKVGFQFTNEFNEGDDDYKAILQFQVREESTDTSWFDRIPLVGGVLDATEQVAAVVAWGFTVILWGLTFITQVALNALITLANSALFLGELGLFMANAYASLVSTAGSWASLFLLVPTVVILLIVTKYVILIVSVLPTT